MILTPHILSGAALSADINNPLAIAAVATSLHFALDAVPHWDYNIRSSKKSAVVKVAADILIASILIFYTIWHLAPDKQINILIGGFFGVLPDGFLLIYFASDKKLFTRFAKFHNFWHYLIAKKGERQSLVLSLASQLIVIAISLILLNTFR